jgi:sugar phosphate permease
MSCWYTRKELALRTSILYSGLLVAQCVSGLLAAGIFSGMDGLAGYAGWQWLFIVEALMSTVCGIAAFFTLPDYPSSKTGSQRWSMNDDMRRLGEARIVADRVTGSGGSGGVLAGLKLVLRDPKAYIFAWMNLVMTAGYGSVIPTTPLVS